MSCCKQDDDDDDDEYGDPAGSMKDLLDSLKYLVSLDVSGTDYLMEYNIS